MISYETFCQIKDYHQRQGLTVAQIAHELDLHPETVSTWLAAPHYRPRQTAARASKLDPFKADILRWLQAHRLSAVQVLQRLRTIGDRPQFLSVSP